MKTTLTIDEAQTCVQAFKTLNEQRRKGIYELRAIGKDRQAANLLRQAVADNLTAKKLERWIEEKNLHK